jgi:hypothetical protein
MAVYVDTARNPFGRMIMCHMWADTAAELHQMAAEIGMKRAWYQAPDMPGSRRVSFPHYDLSQTRRAAAIGKGAIELERQAAVDSRRAIRAHIIDDAEFAKTWRWAA